MDGRRREQEIKDTFTRDELRRIAWDRVLGVPPSLTYQAIGRHTPDSIEMAWQSMLGNLEHASADMRTVAAELDADPRFEGWRER